MTATSRPTPPPPHIAETRYDAVVGPMIRFRGGQVAVSHSVPRNTMDPRYNACIDHHLACDCREALLNEEATERQGEWTRLRLEMARAIRGHATVVEQPDGQPRLDLQCQCQLCDFARVVGLVPRAYYDQPMGQGNHRTVAASYTRGSL